MKVLYGIDCLQRGGTELQVAGLIQRLDRSRFEPILLTTRPNQPELIPDDCHHLEWDVPHLGSPVGLRALGRLVSFLRAEKVDAIHTFFIDTTILVSIAAKLAGVPLRVGSFRDMGYWRQDQGDAIFRWANGTLTHWMANSRQVRDHFIEEYRLPRDRFGVIYNGIDHADLEWVEHSGPTLHVGIVGNLNRKVKRTDLFIAAAGQVAKKHPEITWHILGDGEFRDQLEAQADSCGLAGKAVFTGRIDNVSEYLGKLQVGVNCSDSEGFSNAILEYQFRGCAAVATAVGGNPEAIRDGQTGLLVPPDDTEALAGALEQLVTRKDFRQAIAHRARDEAVRNFSWNRCVTTHQEFYLRGAWADKPADRGANNHAGS